MKKSTLTLFLLGCGAVSLLLLTHCGSGPGTVNKSDNAYATDTADTLPDSLCIADPSWFPHSQTPAPQEGKESPFDASSTTNQIFHQWSWNKFLWLTKPDAGGNPLFLNPAKVAQVSTYMDILKPPTGTQVVLKDVNQAGPKSAILQTNPDYNGGQSQTIYYSIHMNHLMYDAARVFAAALAGGKLNPTNEKSFPVGSFELKVAWVPVSAIPAAKQSQYYTTMASLSTDGGTTYTNTEMALIGMHVVGVVQNHPEFIWATFEHDDLAPNYDWTANSASTTADKLFFKKGSVSGINGILYNTSTKLGVTPYQAFDLFQYGIPRDNTGGFMTTSQQEPADFENVQGINQCVNSHLDDVWNNYFYNGSIWLNTDGQTPQQQAQLINSLSLTNSMGNATPGSSARGSLNCANITMETFTQTFEPDIKSISVSNLANCFSCHSGSNFTNDTIVSPIYLSHTFQDYLLHQQGNSVKKVEDLKTKSEQRVFMRLSK